MRILAEDTMALFIDYQKKLVPVMCEKEKLLTNSKILLNGLMTLCIPYFFTQHYTKGLGMTVEELQEISENSFEYLEKITFSVYDDNTAKECIKRQKKKNIVICGIEAHICVLQTVIDLCSAGYQVIVIEDCIDSRKLNDKERAILRMEKEGAIISTYESVLFELTRSAKNEKFKTILALIK